MKFTLILSSICIGIAIGWISKPNTAPTLVRTDLQGDSNRKTPSAPLPSAQNQPGFTPSLRVSAARLSEEKTDELKLRYDDLEDQISEFNLERKRRRIDTCISKHVAQLNLTPAQEAAFRKAIEENENDFDELNLTHSARPKADDFCLAFALAKIVTDDQRKDYDAIRMREHANKIEAKALRTLASFSDLELDLTEDQKDAAYNLFHKQAEENAGDPSSLPSADDIVVKLNIDSDIVEWSSGNPQPITAHHEGPSIHEIVQKMLDDKVEFLRPVLNDDQLQQYRLILEECPDAMDSLISRFQDRK